MATEGWRARRLSERVFELSEFLVTVMSFSDPGAAYPHKVAYHHSCHPLPRARHFQESTDPSFERRRIQLVPLAEDNVCCGFGGEFSTLYPDISTAMAAEKVEDKAIASGAECLVLGEPGCILNIRGFVRRRGLPLTVLHTAQILAGREAGNEDRGGTLSCQAARHRDAAQRDILNRLRIIFTALRNAPLTSKDPDAALARARDIRNRQ